MENIKQGTDEYNILYDCGSIQHSTLTKCIKSDIPRNLRFDIFFISHFDNDHVNGIKDLIKHGCTFDKVVVPLIDESDNWYYIASQENANASHFIKDLIENPSSAFKGEAQIVKVKVANTKPREIVESINLNELEPEIDSGTKIQLSSRCPEWCYVPFNFDAQQRRADLLADLTKNSSIDASKLNDVHYIDTNRPLIKAAYQNIHPDGSNKTSLIVYSGPSNNGNANIRIHRGLHLSKCYCCGFRYYFEFAGCLYLGDTDLNQSTNGGKNIIDELYSHLASLCENIGFLQIPHHGSRFSYNHKILNINTKISPFCFVSYGHNQHGHPSLRVVEDILTNNSVLHCVTEDRNTALIQLINIP